jgi:hypothetical protein
VVGQCEKLHSRGGRRAHDLGRRKLAV